MNELSEEKLLKNFSRCSDWEEKYLYIIELGNRFCHLSAHECNDDKLVSGCQSNVWLDVQVEGEYLKLRGNSDTVIVKGLVALLIVLTNNKAVLSLSMADIQQFFIDIGIEESITPVRNQGLAAMVQHVFIHLIEE